MIKLNPIFCLAISRAITMAQPANRALGFTDTPMLPGLRYHVHDPNRPHPPVVTPAAEPGGAPSDAIMLFDGKDLSKWSGHPSSITKAGQAGPAEWKLENGYVEVVPGTGDISTKEKFWRLPGSGGMGGAPRGEVE